MSNNNTSTLIVVGMAVIMILCASTVAIIALSSNNNSSFMSEDERDFHEGYAAGYAEAQAQVVIADANTISSSVANNSIFKLVNTSEMTTLGVMVGVNKDKGSETGDTVRIRGAELLTEGEAAKADDLPTYSEAYKFGFSLGYKDGSSVDSAFGLNDDFSLFLNKEKVKFVKEESKETSLAKC